MGISPAVLLRWQPKRLEVSLSLVCVLADRLPPYFLVDSYRSFHGVSIYLLDK